MKPKNSNKPSGPVKVGNVTVSVDRDLCIGAGSCSAIAAKAFLVDKNSKAIILESADENDYNLLLNAAKSCPTAAIRIVDASGKVLFPK